MKRRQFLGNTGEILIKATVHDDYQGSLANSLLGIAFRAGHIVEIQGHQRTVKDDLTRPITRLGRQNLYYMDERWPERSPDMTIQWDK